MTYPSIGNHGTTSAGTSAPASTGTTSSFAVNAGDSVYVFIGYAEQYGSNTIKVSSVTDSSGNLYRRAGGIANGANSIYPAIDVWYADNVPAAAALTVSVGFPYSTLFTISAVQIKGADTGGSLDAVSLGKTGSSLPTSAPSSQDPITSVNANDLIVACVCFSRGVGTVSNGGGFTSTSAISVLGGSGTGNTGIQGFYDNASTAGSYDGKIYCANSGYSYAIFTVAIRQASGVSQWSGIAGRPFATVSPRGIANGLASVLNNGADFGPDTPGTTTSGIQEALNLLSGGGTIYCQNGTFNLSSPLINTGSNQQVIFAAGSSVVFQSTTVPWVTTQHHAVLIMVGTNNGTTPATYANYSHCKWLGFGTTINANLAGYNSGSGGASVFGIVQAGLQQGSSILPGTDIEIDGFILQNIPATAVTVGLENYEDITALTNPAQNYQLSNVRIGRVSATWPGTGTGSVFGIAVLGSVRSIAIEDCVMDASGVGGTSMHSNLFLTAGAGEAEQIRVSRSTFINNSLGSSFELQGNTSTVNTSQQRSLHEVLIEDCIFDSGGTTVGYHDQGGGTIDDVGTTANSTYGYVYNIEFRRTTFVNVGVTTSGAQHNLNGTKTKFAYLRFTDDSSPGGYNSTAYGILLGRGPADSGVDLTSPTIPGCNLGNGSTWYNYFGFPIQVFISNGSPSSIIVNGFTTGLLSGVFLLRQGDSLLISWTSQPTVQAQSL